MACGGLLIVAPTRVYSYARQAGFPPHQAAVMTAIAARESGFNARAVNCSSGATGLWQVLKGGSTDPRENARQARALFTSSVAAGYSGFRPWYSSGGVPAPYPGVGDVKRKGHRAPRPRAQHPRTEARGATIPGMGPCAGGGGGGFKGAVENVVNQGLGLKLRTCSCDERYPSGSKTLGILPTGGAENFLCKLPRYLEVAAGGLVMALGLGVLVVSATGGTTLPVPSVAALSALKGATRAPSASRTAAPARPDLAADRAAASTARRQAAEQMARRRRAEADVSEHYADVTLERKRVTGTQRRPTFVRHTGEEVRT